MTADAGMVPVYRPANAWDLAFCRGLLESADIPFFIENEHYFGAAGGIYGVGDTEVRVFVPADHAQHAAMLLQGEGQS